MIRPQTTIEEILGNQKIELTRYNHSRLTQGKVSEAFDREMSRAENAQPTHSHQQTKPFEIAQLKPLETISSRSNGKDKTADDTYCQQENTSRTLRSNNSKKVLCSKPADTIYTLQQIRDYNDRCVI